jgi:DNA-binding CsgD family transcriptional regulator
MSTTEPITYPLGWHSGKVEDGQAMALLALSHTVIEHQLYDAMLSETYAVGTRVGAFSVRRLMALTGLSGYNTVRRGLAGLCKKLSVERQLVAGDNSLQNPGSVYLVFSPEEIFTRRRAAGQAPFPKEIKPYRNNRAFGLAVERVVGHYNLSRREAQVALCCVEGLTNAEIGERLFVSCQTIKFHLRHIYAKFGVKRRTELVSRLLMPDSEPEGSERSR